MPGKPKPNELRNLKLTEVSLVDAGANPGAHVVLWKRHEPAAPIPADGETKGALRKRFDAWLANLVEKAGARSFNDVFQEQQLREAMYETTEKLWDAFYAFCESNGSVLADEEVSDKAAKLQANASQFKAALDNLLPQLVAAGDDDAAKRGPKPTPSNGGGIMKFKTLEEALAHIEATETSVAALTVSLGDANKALAKALERNAANEDPEEAIKSLPANLQGIVRESRAAVAKVAEMEDRDLTRKIASRLTFKHLGNLNPDTFAITLKRIYQGKTTAADAEELLGLMKGWNEGAKLGGLFGERGQRGGATGKGAGRVVKTLEECEDHDDVLALLDTRAKELQAKNAGMTHEVAVTKAMEADPALYDAYRATLAGHAAQYQDAEE